MLLHITKARKLIYFIFKPIEILLLMLLLITKARKLIYFIFIQISPETSSVSWRKQVIASA